MNENVKKVVTTSLGVGMFPPDQENLVDPDSHAELDYERCVQCGYCRLVCRVYNTTYAERDYAGGRNRIERSISTKKKSLMRSTNVCCVARAARFVQTVSTRWRFFRPIDTLLLKKE